MSWFLEDALVPAGYNCVHNGLTVSEQKDVFLKTELLGFGGFPPCSMGTVTNLQSDIFYHFFVAMLEFWKVQEYHLGN